ncbi:hypothetical protein [Pseudoduganella lutea]|uniref:Uncharacterized protein n=1 Tax=Pseudoduganella lutea TaxID=321985 RepID=A0A4P6KW20_9BURK|nr:hypothetical protein [Pseudoduganella lutea]QBE62885.1 hypothetical protein EWM63_07810 [Pseudoduganella lutea]
MKTINKTCTDTVQEAWNAMVRILRHAIRRLERMPWPTLLTVCVMLALLITLLPLALTLFVLFLLVKLAANALGAGRHAPHRRDHAHPDAQ